MTYFSLARCNTRFVLLCADTSPLARRGNQLRLITLELFEK